MESVLPFVLLGLAVGLLIWGVNNLSVEGRYTKLFPISATAVGVALLGWFFSSYAKDGILYAVFSALFLIGLLGWGLLDPLVGRRLETQDLRRNPPALLGRNVFPGRRHEHPSGHPVRSDHADLL